ncbi:MAG: hypothetical protein K2O11_05930 [Oscillospiraceae bacterium]|nr:hypothetical protein [Oscillospiraceae bacterium]
MKKLKRIVGMVGLKVSKMQQKKLKPITKQVAFQTADPYAIKKEYVRTHLVVCFLNKGMKNNTNYTLKLGKLQ